jgi:hypothetical protein
MEAAGLGLFMVSASLFGTLREYPQSPVHRTTSAAFFVLLVRYRKPGEPPSKGSPTEVISSALRVLALG